MQVVTHRYDAILNKYIYSYIYSLVCTRLYKHIICLPIVPDVEYKSISLKYQNFTQFVCTTDILFESRNYHIYYMTVPISISCYQSSESIIDSRFHTLKSQSVSSNIDPISKSVSENRPNLHCQNLIKT